MEYVPGRTLKELIAKRGALHVMEAIDIMKQVLQEQQEHIKWELFIVI